MSFQTSCPSLIILLQRAKLKSSHKLLSTAGCELCSWCLLFVTQQDKIIWRWILSCLYDLFHFHFYNWNNVVLLATRKKNSGNNCSGEHSQPVLCLIFYTRSDSFFPHSCLWSEMHTYMRPRTQYQSTHTFIAIKKFNKLFTHFLFVTWEFLITEWFFAAICYSSIKQIIYSQVIKITKKPEHASNVTSASCTMSTNDPHWKHLYWRSLQDLHTSLPGQVTLQLGKGISINCGSAPGCKVDGSLTQVQLWLQFSKALKSHWLCFGETHLCFAESLLLNCTWDWTQ